MVGAGTFHFDATLFAVPGPRGTSLRKGQTMLFLSLAASFILLTVVIWAAWFRKEAVVPAFIAGFLFSFAPMCLMFYLPVVVAHSVLVVIATLIWQVNGWRF